MALLIAVILLLLMSALGVSALQHSNEESSGSGRSRRKDATLYAAEAGQALAQKKIYDIIGSWSGTSGTFTIDEPAMTTDGYGNPIAVRGGLPSPSGLPTSPAELGKPAAAIKSATHKEEDGTMLNLNNANARGQGWVTRIDIVAQDQGNGLVHLQTQYVIHN